MSPQTTRIVGVVVVVIVVAVVLFLLLHHGKKHHGSSGGYKVVPAFIINSAARLQAERGKIGGELFYWAGPKSGYEYEFRRTKDGYVYVRYLPSGLHAGAIGNYLVVATYPGYTNSVAALKKQAKTDTATVKKGKGGSVYFVDPKRPRTLYMAWSSHLDVQVELFAPTPNDAAHLAKSGAITAVPAG